MKIFSTLILVVLLVCISSIAQTDGDPISIGKYRTLHSEILKEERVLSITLPKNYDSAISSYPVVYHLYGDRIEQYYSEATSVINQLSSDGAMPEVILIGIDERNQRYRDLLPQANDGSDTGIMDFTRFINEEVFPFVETNYRTKPYRILVGPQVGANFGIYTLFTNPDLFDAFIINNPFRWTGGRDLLFDKLEHYTES